MCGARRRCGTIAAVDARGRTTGGAGQHVPARRHGPPRGEREPSGEARRGASPSGGARPADGARPRRGTVPRRGTDPRPDARRGGGVTGVLAGVAGRHVSALVVLFWCTVAALASLLAPWALSVVVACAAPVLALGWAGLTQVPLSRAEVGVCVLTGAAGAVAVQVTRDLSATTTVLALGFVALSVAVLASHGAVGSDVSRGPAGSGRPPRAVGSVPSSAPTRTDVIPDPVRSTRSSVPLAAVGAPVPRRRRSGRRRDSATLPSLLSAPAAACCLLVAVGGSAWVALSVRDQWLPAVPFTCLLAVVVVLGDQVGGTFRSNSIGAVLTGVVCGAVAGSALGTFGPRGVPVSTVLPSLARLVGERPASVLAGIVVGLAVALVVVVVDGLLGDHARPTSLTGAIARGTAKFLVAVLPVYALIRIGGI